MSERELIEVNAALEDSKVLEDEVRWKKKQILQYNEKVHDFEFTSDDSFAVEVSECSKRILAISSVLHQLKAATTTLIYS